MALALRRFGSADPFIVISTGPISMMASMTVVVLSLSPIITSPSLLTCSSPVTMALVLLGRRRGKRPLPRCCFLCIFLERSTFFRPSFPLDLSIWKYFRCSVKLDHEIRTYRPVRVSFISSTNRSLYSTDPSVLLATEVCFFTSSTMCTSTSEASASSSESSVASDAASYTAVVC